MFWCLISELEWMTCMMSRIFNKIPRQSHQIGCVDVITQNFFSKFFHVKGHEKTSRPAKFHTKLTGAQKIENNTPIHPNTKDPQRGA
jgi:hypothetical protein